MPILFQHLIITRLRKDYNLHSSRLETFFKSFSLFVLSYLREKEKNFLKFLRLELSYSSNFELYLNFIQTVLIIQ